MALYSASGQTGRANLIKLHATKLAIFALVLVVQTSTADLIKSTNPSHATWTDKQSRFDFVFNVDGNTIGNIVKLETDATNFITNSLNLCSNYSACLFQDGQHIQSFNLANESPHKSKFNTIRSVEIHRNETSFNSTFLQECKDNEISVIHYCSTHWNPPAYLFRNKCNHAIEWHSPLRCHSVATNYERPCYLYDSAGKLIDLTPWVLSNGSSYQVDLSASNFSISKFNINVCNEAHIQCGPNISACYTDKTHGLIESGFNNLTSIKYDEKETAVLLTSLGQFNEHCADSSIKTVVRFLCDNKISDGTGPKLIRSSACESIIEWKTVHACPVVDTKVPATECKIHYEPFKIDLDLKQLSRNLSAVAVTDLELDGTNKTMLLSICQGLPKTTRCGGKTTSATAACLVNARDSSNITAANSQIVGSITNSFIRFADDRLYLESTAINKSCVVSTEQNLNVTRQIGTRIEYFCTQSQEQEEKPTFLGFDNCVYIFEWGSPSMCLDHVGTNGLRSSVGDSETSIAASSSTPASHELKTDLPKESSTEQTHDNKQKESKSALEKHIETLSDSKKMTHGFEHRETVSVTTPVASQQKPVAKEALDSNSTQAEVDAAPVEKPPQPQPKMNAIHKYFLISLIVMSLTAFIVVILVLDKKTRLRVPLSSFRRRAGQAFQTQPVPYTRVDDFHDGLDL